MKKFKTGKAYLVFMLILTVFIVSGCSGGGDVGFFGGGHWNEPPGFPAVNFTDPASGDTLVPINKKVAATFTRAMDPATINGANFSLKETNTNLAVAGAVTYNGVTAVFTPTANLTPSTVYTGTITTGATDTGGRGLAGNYVFEFNTGLSTDTTKPTVSGTINANGATNVAANSKAGVTFSEGMNPASITNANFTLNETVSGAAVAGTVSYSGVSAVFTPSANLAFNRGYTVTIKGGVGGVEDLAGNTMAADFVNSWTTGSAPDTTPPTVTGTINANGATNVAVNTKVGATFSEGMNPLTITNQNFTLKQTVSGAAVAGTVNYSGVSAVFTPSGNLAFNTNYTVTVKGGVGGVEDLAGNPMAADFVISWTTGAAPDTTPPTVTGTIHANGQTNVAVNTSVGATFSEGMNPLTITNLNFTLKQTVSGAAVAGTVNYSGVSAVFIPSSNLAFSTNYTVTVKGGVGGVKDLAGNPMAADFVISWTTGVAPDTTAPTVTGTIHANGQTNVPVNTTVGATFSEGMDPLTITNLNFTLKQTGFFGSAVAGTVSYSGVSAVFIPSSNLAFSTNYTVTVKGGASGVKDLAGNPMAADFVISWTTGAAPDTTAPTVTGTIHANGQTNVPVNTKVGATFSEGMNPLTITNLNFTLKQTVSGAAVAGTVSYSGVNAVFIPSSNLASNTGYTVTVKGGVSGVTDLAGNPMAADFTISWTTGAILDTTAPTVIGTINANGATNVPVNTKVGATFSEAMDPLTINNMNFKLEDKLTLAEVTGTVTYSGVNAVFTPFGDLVSNHAYTATIRGGVNGGVKDLAGNLMASDYVWSWTTGAALDTTRPTVTLLNPADLATNVATSSAVNATFSKAMDPLTISTATFRVAGVTGLVTYNATTNVATFTPSSALAVSTTYTATVTTGVADLAGNTMLVDKVWSFTTAAAPVVPPVVNLRTSARYGTFGGTAGMTNQGINTIINGDIGTIATTTSTVTGFHDTEGDIFTQTTLNIGGVNGTIYTCTNSVTGPNSTGVNAAYCALATQARLDAQTAYNFLAAMPSTGVLAGNLAGTTINPGVYTNASSVLIQGGDLTLDALGDANAIFVFQIGSTLTLGGPGAAFPQSIILAGGAQAKNVFWQVGTFATINAGGGGTMVGTIISQAGVSFSTAGNVTLVTLNGRALSLGASVTMVNTVINVPAP
jgi:hypothetical protein